jgi:hypothetical protein
MRRVLALLIVCCTATGLNQNDHFTDLSKLVGLWRMQEKNGSTFESWSRVNENELSSFSYNVTGSDTTRFEDVRLNKTAEGITYTSQVHDQNDDQPVSFKLVSVNNATFTFENLKHDFPQRIIYTFIKNDSIVARIEGESKGKIKGFDYYYKRVK